MRPYCLALFGLFIVTSGAAQQDATPTAIESLIIDANPCASASTDLMGMAVGVDQLRSISVERASVVIEGDIMTSNLIGGLACESSAGAVAPGFVSAAIDAEVVIDLSTCIVGETSVTINNAVVEIDMPGLMGAVGELFEEQLPLLLEPALRRSLSERAVTACKQLEADR